MAELMADEFYDNEEDDETEMFTRPGEDRQAIDDHFEVPGQEEVASIRSARKRRGRLGRQRATMKELGSMLKNDWISTVTVVIDTGGVGPSRWSDEPAREMSDTGAASNLVSSVFLEQAGFAPEKMKPCDEQVFEGVVPDVTPTANRQVELRWYRQKSKKIHKSTFLVVENDAFEIIVGSDKISENFRLPAYTVAGRRRTKDEIRKAQEAREKQRKAADEQRRKKLGGISEAKSDDSEEPADVELVDVSAS